MNLILNNLFNYTDNDGIFNYLNKYNVPWKQDLDIDILNLDYHSRYGIRVVSKQVTSLLNTDGLSSQNKDKLAKLIYSRNAIKWQKLWDSNALYDSFNPLDNTNWTEKTTIAKSGGDNTETNYGAVEETFEKGEQNNSNNNGAISNTTENRKSAFNSSSYQPENSVKSDTTAQNNTSTDGARTDKDTTKARTDTSSIIYGSKEETTVHREGNIGITDTPTLIRNFRGLLSWQILDTIYEDINDILVISLFGDDDATFDDYKIVNNYVLPVASADTLGGVKIGTNLHIDSNGVLSAEAEAGNVQSVNGQTGNVVLTNIDVNAPSVEEFNNLATSKQDILIAGSNITIVDNVISASGGGGVGKIYLPSSKVVRWKGYVYGGSIGTVPSTNEYSFAIDLTDFIENGYVYYLQYSPLTSKVTKERNYIRLGSNSVYLPPGDDATEWSKSIEWYENNNRSWSTYNNLYTYVLDKNKKGFYFQPGCSEPVVPGVDFMLSVWKEPSMFNIIV